MKQIMRMMLSTTGAILIALLVVEVAYPWLAVSPYRIEVDLPFGATAERTIVVINLSDSSKLVEPSVRGFRLRPSGDLVWLSPDGKDARGNIYEYGAISALLEINPAEVTLPAGSSAEFTVRILAPGKHTEGAPAGRVGALLFTASPMGVAGQESPLFESSFRVVTFLLIRFNEHQQSEVHLRETDIQQRLMGGLRFSARLENTGNVHLCPQGQILVRDMLTGQVVAELGLSEGTLLPECERVYYCDWDYPEGLTGTFEAMYVISCRDDQESELVTTGTFEMLEGKLKREKASKG